MRRPGAARTPDGAMRRPGGGTSKPPAAGPSRPRRDAPEMNPAPPQTRPRHVPTGTKAARAAGAGGGTKARTPPPGRQPTVARGWRKNREPEEAEAPEDEGTEAKRQAKAPWHFKFIVVGSVVYLGWRLYQGISWLAHHV